MASRGEDTPRTMTMMGGPIDARLSPTSVNSLAMRHSHEWFENNVIYKVPPNYPGHGRHVYPGFLQHTGFVAMNPGRHMNSHYDFYESLLRGDEEDAEAHRVFYNEYNAVLDMAAEYYLDTIKVVFQEFRLAEGTWVVNGEPVRPQDIRDTALLTIEGEFDDIFRCWTNTGSPRFVQGHSGVRQASYDRQQNAATMGFSRDDAGATRVYPQLRDFILAHDREVETEAALSGLVAARSRGQVPARLPAQWVTHLTDPVG